MQTRPNNPANPIGDAKYFSGLTKREYMATQALAGILANDGKEIEYDEAAEYAVGHADALIEALNKKDAHGSGGKDDADQAT